jgi:glyoxylase-like metal-dependent hydrolase (beta-lactamase superfamily II)
MPEPIVYTRRAFLADLGRGGIAIAIVGVAAACAPASVGGSGAATAAGSAGPSVTSASAATASAAATAAGSTASAWTRVNLGFVSAYVLAREGEAAIVDTGVAGSEGEIAASLESIGIGWDAVGHVILTHKHPDHAGSIAAVLDAAAGATGYVGPADLSAVTAPRPLTAVNDGDRVFDLRIIGTPGHTAGHISVLDEASGGTLVAGDALGTTGGALAGSNPQFTEDPAAAAASVIKLGGLTFEALLVGHGDPIEAGASARVAALAAG